MRKTKFPLKIKNKKNNFINIFLTGIVFGVAIRCGSPLSLHLAESMWKLAAGNTLNMEDLQELDRGFVSKHSYLTSVHTDNIVSPLEIPCVYDEVAALDLPFTVRSASGNDVCLSKVFNSITRDNRHEYLKASLKYRLHEFDEQIQWIRAGLSQVVPVPLLSLFTGSELENMVCGSPEISVDSLKSITSYRGIECDALLVKWFWQSLEEFTNHERSLFLRFVWGRTRLPRTAMDFKGKDFIFQVRCYYYILFLKLMLGYMPIQQCNLFFIAWRVKNTYTLPLIDAFHFFLSGS